MSSAGALGAVPAVAAEARAGAQGRSQGSRHRTRLVLLGTAGGPVTWGGSRSGVSTAVAYEDRVYVVDLGLGSFHRLGERDLVPKGVTNSALTNVRGIFLTHMHSDHLADLMDFGVGKAMRTTSK